MICLSRDRGSCISSLVGLLLLCLVTALSQQPHQVLGFHLSFSHRLLKSAPNQPQLNPASTLIRPIECRNANNHSEVGICMFSIDCMQNKGTPLSVCKHNYFVGTCCRLPDYNNFVGIVYDLRDTEGQLEVRRIPLDRIRAQAALTSEAPTSPTPPPAAPTSTPAADLVVSSRASPDESSMAPTNPTSTYESSASSSTGTSVNYSNEERLMDKYIVSSTSLFPASASVAPMTTPLSERREPEKYPEGTPVARVGESARNADGALPAPLNSSQSSKLQSIVMAGEQDSFQIHTDTSTRQSSPIEAPAVTIQGGPGQLAEENKQHSAYELIKDDSLDILATVNSVHSPPTTQQQFNIVPDHQDSKKSPQVSAESSESANELKPVHQGSVYLFDEQTAQKQANIVINKNHQHSTPASSTQRPPEPTQSLLLTSPTLNLKAQSQQPAGDQEFTLSSAPSGPNDEPDTRSTKPSFNPPEVIQINQTSTGLAFSLPASSSPFVDLVSNANSAQSTTPFTTSLSTALLPNVSSHPYAPTAAPSLSLSSLVSTYSSRPSARPGEEPSSFGFSQLYSNQHGESQPPPASPQSTSYLSRPNINHMTGPQVASKIVTGSGSLPQNNLLPGLSGLQSAILSHIPFKIASGLSSGLSSYLQAAMKPTGSRPLLSSNTAPSLQYQQQMQANATRLQAASSAVSAVRFPAPSGTSTSAPVSSSPAAAADDQVLASNSTQSAGGSTSAEVLRDVVKEAQLVCGRPQVPSQSEGKKRVARIVGGNQSLFGQWPWMVSLRQWRKGAFLHKCGAALLNENWAITAAHCVENVKVTDLLLRLGEFDVSNQNEPYPYIERRVKSVVSHPSFDPKTFEYDLALLRFAEPIKYERNIVPVCVPSGNDTYVDRMATVIGWGRLYEDGPLPDVIQHVDVPIITNNECEKMYKNAGYIEEIPDMFICAGISKGGRDSCEGDSGGPLTMIDYDGRSYLVGIISWGIGCALPSQPGVYTRITAFSGWINQITAF